MEKNPQSTLEELIHRELAKLPARPAPETLIPRVLMQIQARAQRRWWHRPWTGWPFPIQLASLAFLLLSAALFVLGAWVPWQFLPSAPAAAEPLTEQFTLLAWVWELLATLGNALMVLVRSSSYQWFLLLALSIPMAMYLTCVGLGTLCYRMALSRR